MTSTTAQQITKANTDTVTKNGNAAEQIIKRNADAMTKNGEIAEHITKANADILTESGTAAMAGLQELIKAYQASATKNVEKLTTSIQALAAVTTPAEFIELQQRLITESIDAAVSDCGNIAKLTAAMFTAALDPVQKQVAELQNTLKSRTH
ncbi:MAG TPA: phasin family protein [Stellaceae bacterium]|nr:phasin family protein [Stellaceae bacterium]